MCGISGLVHKAAGLAVYGYKYNGKMYLKHLRNKGMRIGSGTVLFNAKMTTIDESDPQMIIIGKNVQITGGVVILSHDYGWAVTKAVYGDVLGSVRPVSIGDNVYIGMNAMILAGSRIGSNVIIGANSVVSGTIPDNCVAVGSPCRKVYDIDEYHKKRQAAQLSEAVTMAQYYFDCYGHKPPETVFSEHFWLWTNDQSGLPELFSKQNNLMPGSEESTWRKFKYHNPIFNSFNDFLDFALEQNGLQGIE